MKYTDVSFDLETLSTEPNALILSIGYCLFNRHTGEVGPSFQHFVNPLSQPTRSISLATVKWWWGQDKEAKKALWQGLKASLPLEEALYLIRVSLLPVSLPNLAVWGNGPEFDNVILQTAYKGKTPWRFWQNNSVRTVSLQVQDKTGERLKDLLPFDGVKHDAEADARHQAKIVIKAYEILGLTGTTEPV